MDNYDKALEKIGSMEGLTHAMLALVDVYRPQTVAPDEGHAVRRVAAGMYRRLVKDGDMSMGAARQGLPGRERELFPAALAYGVALRWIVQTVDGLKPGNSAPMTLARYGPR